MAVLRVPASRPAHFRLNRVEDVATPTAIVLHSTKAAQCAPICANSSRLPFIGKLILAREMRRDARLIGRYNLTVVTKILVFLVPTARSYVSIAVESK